MRELKEDKLDFYIKNNLNVLFIGKHGVGKTSMVKDAFERAKLRYLYFSASTLDPWVDFVGVPKEVDDGNGRKYLELIRPKAFSNDEVEAIFLDEYNRSPKKVRNAVMELIQFKSINGQKFHNLKIIWAAINPEDDESSEYDVEKLDPAQKDRFQVHVSIPYNPSLNYFKNKYGLSIAKSAISWWNELPTKMQNFVSPRRLDYALEMHNAGGDLSDVLDQSTGITKLYSYLKNGPLEKAFLEIFEKKDTVAASSFIKENASLLTTIGKLISKNVDYIEFYFPLFPKELQSLLMEEEKSVCSYVLSNTDMYFDLIESIIQANKNIKLIRTIKTNKNYILTIKKNYLNRFIKSPASDLCFKPVLKKSNLFEKFRSNYARNFPTGKKPLPIPNTIARLAFFDGLKQIIYKDMDMLDTLFVLDALELVAINTQVGTLKRKFNEYSEIFNLVIKEIQRNTGKSFDQIEKDFLFLRANNVITKITALANC